MEKRKAGDNVFTSCLQEKLKSGIDAKYNRFQGMNNQKRDVYIRNWENNVSYDDSRVQLS